MLRTGAKQKHRTVAVNTPLGEDTLVLQRIVATEAMGRMFEFRLYMLSSDQDIQPEDLLGQNATVRYERPAGGTRYFNGYFSEFSYVGERGAYAAYEGTLRPWLWFFTRTADCRIFQNETVPDIITQVFQDQGFTDFRKSLTRSYRQWEYCVQYRETDFNFVSRLMEQEGIYYYFKHENGKHELVLADSISAHETFPGTEDIPVHPSERQVHVEHVSQLKMSKQVLPGNYALNDFNFKTVKADLKSNSPQIRGHDNDAFEIYDYPGEYIDTGEGSTCSRNRIEELHAQFEIMRGKANASGIAAGYLATLKDHARGDQNRELLITSATYDIKAETYESGGGAAEFFSESYYDVEFSAIASQETFRSQRTTPKPTIPGPQTAIVVGKSGEEIDTDEFGRVKVQFHWDRYGKMDQDSSCWIRVAQIWAGKQWGGIYIPRIGQEVIVEFLEGDPDRPIITGRVYNGDAKPPYDLPANKTRSTIKSNSSKGGGGFNEFRIEDKKGSEQIFMHAEKDMDVRVKNISKEWIGKDRHLIIKEGDQFEELKKGSKHLIVKKDQKEEVKGDKHQKVVGDHNQKIGGTLSIKADMNTQQKSGMNYAHNAGMGIHLKAGTTTVIEATAGITLKVGGNSVNITPAGVQIKGTMVMINSMAMPLSGSGSSPASPAAPTAAKEADSDKAGQVSTTQSRAITKQKKGKRSSTAAGSFSKPQAKALAGAASSGAPFCEVCGD